MEEDEYNNAFNFFISTRYFAYFFFLCVCLLKKNIIFIFLPRAIILKATIKWGKILFIWGGLYSNLKKLGYSTFVAKACCGLLSNI